MNTETIKITIDKDGNVSIETAGFSGFACDRATAEFEALLGGEIEKTYTDEAFQGEADSAGAVAL